MNRTQMLSLAGGRRSLSFISAISALSLFSIGFSTGRLAAQTNGIWAHPPTGGLWSQAINWQSGVIASGTGASADFSQLILPANNTVHLNEGSSFTLGSLIFGDQGNTFNWTLDNNGSSSNVLNLANPSGNPPSGTVQPSITVNNGTATISAVIAGGQGLTVNPGGQTGTLVLSGANTFFDNPSTNQSAGGITIDGGTLSIASDVPAGTT